MHTHIIPFYKYKFIDLNYVYTVCNKEYNKYIYQNNISDKTTLKKIFFHTYIFNICNFIIENNKTHIPVIVFDSSCNTVSKDEIKLFKRFSNMFPVLFINHQINFNTFKELLNSEGYKQEILSSLFSLKQKNTNKKYYFSKIHSFCKKYELNFLNKNFFGNIKNKMNLV